MIDALLGSSSTTRMLEQTMNFTEQRHMVLLEDIANATTPGFVQRDMDVSEFQGALQQAMTSQREGFADHFAPPSSDTLSFDQDSSDISSQPVEVPAAVPFHDRGVRSMEYLMSQLADNAQAHNMAAQFLKSRYDTIARAISMKV